MTIKYCVFCLFLIYCTYSYSQVTNIQNNQDTTAILNIKPTLTISKCANKSITIDGRLDEPVWKTSACAKNFVEIDPGDNTKPSVQTEAYLLMMTITFMSDLSIMKAIYQEYQPA